MAQTGSLQKYGVFLQDSSAKIHHIFEMIPCGCAEQMVVAG